MKTILFGAAAAVAVLAAGAVNAQELTTRYVGGSYTTINTGSATNDDASIIAARAVGSFQLSEGVEVQVDGDIASVDLGYSSASNTTTWGPTIHVFRETEGGSKVGFLLGYQDIEDLSLMSYGVEGRFAASENISFGALAVWGQLNTKGGSSNPDVSAYEIEGSYFPNDNARIDLTYTQNRITGILVVPTSSHLTLSTIHLGGEVQLEIAPVSVTFGIDRTSTSGSSFESFSLGIRHSFGGTLKERDRTSSPFKGLPGIFGTLFQAEVASAAQEDGGDMDD